MTIKRTLCGLLAAFFLASCGATADKHDTTMRPTQAMLDLMQIEADQRQAMIEWQQAMQKIEAERVEYEAALEAALVARRATGDEPLAARHHPRLLTTVQQPPHAPGVPAGPVGIKRDAAGPGHGHEAR